MWLGTCGLLRAGEFVQKPTTKYSLNINISLSMMPTITFWIHTILKGEIPLYMSLDVRSVQN